MLRTIVLACLVACVSGFDVAALRPVSVVAKSSIRAERVAAPATPQRSSRAVVMSTPMPSSKESTVAIAIAGAFLGVTVFDNLITAAFLSGLFAYLTTTDGKAGEAATSAGAFLAKSYGTALKFADEKALLPKAKEVTDKVVAALTAINDNYGITSKLDEKLLISDKVATATEKLSEVKSTVSTKYDELTSAMK